MATKNKITIELDDRTYRQLQEFAEKEGLLPEELTRQAILEYQKKQFFKGLNEDIETVKRDRPADWQQYVEGQKELEATLADGIE